MKRTTLLLISILALSGCVAVPTPAKNYQSRCEISSDRLTLRVIDVAQSTNSYYSIEGLILTPIVVPTTALLSGVFVLVNNIYNIGEEKIVCSETKQGVQTDK